MSYFGISLLILFSSCKGGRTATGDLSDFMAVKASAETRAVPRDTASDAADDPAIWVNPRDADSSLIIGTDKQGGLAIYDLEGNELHYYSAGKMNNADLRYDFVLGNDTLDILAASNRSGNTIDLFSIRRNGTLEVIHASPLKSKVKDEVYGLCMYKSSKTGKLYVFADCKDGEVEQWELYPEGGRVNGKIVRTLKIETQVEGIVADDAKGLLYIGEEDKGIWRMDAEPSADGDKELLNFSTESGNSRIKFDIEGLAIFGLPDGSGYLLASSQGNDSYAVFDRNPPNLYIGSFRIADGQGADGTQETDGIDVISSSLGKHYPCGLFVAQDGSNTENGRKAPQNFKLVRWDSIAKKFDPPLALPPGCN